MQAKKIKILLVTTNALLSEQLVQALPADRYEIHTHNSLEKLLYYFNKKSYDLLLLSGETCRDKSPDYKDLLKVLSLKSPRTQILILVEKRDIKIAIDALKFGTYQYVKLPVPDDELKLLIQTALEQKPQYGENVLLEQGQSQDRFEQFVGRSKPMQRVYQQIRQVASIDIPVLLLGETGTGKDLAAKAIHRLSERSEGPFIPVNLGAFPSDLVASELFGHEKGAFTGAQKQHIGVFEQGNRGVVFLDEIDCIDEKVQVSLLRLIEQKKFYRLGGRKTVQSNARLVTASNSNIPDLVNNGSFREDLFYRLEVFTINIPPLRRRQQDIVLITEYYISHFNTLFKKKVKQISEDCLNTFNNYEWPGNVRELKNVIQRAVLVCNEEKISPKHLPERFRPVQKAKENISLEIGTTLHDAERELILFVLTHTNNQRTEAAKLLGISRRALYNKLSKHKIE